MRIIEKQGFEKEHFLLNPAHFFSGFPTFFLIYSTENDITSSVSDPFFFCTDPDPGEILHGLRKNESSIFLFPLFGKN